MPIDITSKGHQTRQRLNPPTLGVCAPEVKIA
jgi:hypothetical protein